MKTFTIDDLDYLTSECADLVLEIDSGRWSSYSEIVFTDEDSGKQFVVNIEEGLTEMQDYYKEQRYPYHRREGEEYVVDCEEVEIYEEMVPQRKWRVKAT